MKNLQTFESFSADSLNEGTFNVVPVGMKGKEYFVKINGKEYGYSEQEEGVSLADVVEKFKKLLKYNAGRALSWLKSNSKLTSGSAKNEAEDLAMFTDFVNESVEDFYLDITLSEAIEESISRGSEGKMIVDVLRSLIEKYSLDEA